MISSPSADAGVVPSVCKCFDGGFPIFKPPHSRCALNHAPCAACFPEAAKSFQSLRLDVRDRMVEHDAYAVYDLPDALIAEIAAKAALIRTTRR